MRLAPRQRAELLHGDEARQIEHLALQVLAIAHAAQVKQLCPCGRVKRRFSHKSGAASTQVQPCLQKALDIEKSYMHISINMKAPLT